MGLVGNNHDSKKQSRLTARGLFFLGELIVPGVVAQTQLSWKRLGFADAHLPALVQKLLNKRIVSSFFADLFHTREHT
jgi:hypothetical protein